MGKSSSKWDSEGARGFYLRLLIANVPTTYQSRMIPRSPSPKSESPKLFPSLSFWHLQIFGWGAFFIVPFFFWASHRAEAPLMWLLMTRPIFGFLITTAVSPVCQHLYQRRVKLFPLVAMMVSFSLVVSFLELLVMIPLGQALGIYPSTQSLTAIFPILLTIRFWSLLLWFILYFGLKSQQESARLKMEFQQSEINLLRSNVDPHFLFNALTTIMAVRKDEQKVSLVVQALADYLRFSLSQHQEKNKSYLHPLQKELDALKNYLEVEKVRFGEDLEWHYDIGEGTGDFPVASALVQPLLENAIKYGQLTSPKPLIIRITARIEEKNLSLCIENTGLWETAVQPSESIGSGIANLERRLELLYRGSAKLSYETSNGVVRAHLLIPPLTP